ncbi:MAG: VOC family protein [Acidimicrobiales bacterium]
MTNDMNYFEIGTSDPEASRTFYGALFDWKFGEPSMPARYSAIDENRGGLWDTSHMGAENWAIFYVQVDDVHTATCTRRSTAPNSSARQWPSR